MSEIHYAAPEERLNVITHAIGVILSIIGLIFLLLKASSGIANISVAIFGMGLITLYTASTLYHAAKDKEVKRKWRIFDHAAIYVLIAGTYTPVCLITLGESVGIMLLYIIWSVAVLGVILKLFYTGKYDKISTAMYVAMGWIAVFAIHPLLTFMSTDGLLWLVLGGLCYTLGAVVYSIRKIPFNHAIFHLFVLWGSACHFVMIYSYVLV